MKKISILTYSILVISVISLLYLQYQISKIDERVEYEVQKELKKIDIDVQVEQQVAKQFIEKEKNWVRENKPRFQALYDTCQLDIQGFDEVDDIEGLLKPFIELIKNLE